jgi:hypothetical protein
LRRAPSKDSEVRFGAIVISSTRALRIRMRKRCTHGAHAREGYAISIQPEILRGIALAPDFSAGVLFLDMEPT